MNIKEKGKPCTNLLMMKEALEFYIKRLKIPKKTNITVVFTDQYMGKKFLGKCYNTDEKHLIFIRKSMDSCQKLKILAHELTHVKQHIKNEYVITHNPDSKDFDVYRYGILFAKFEDISYKDRPWEIEAKRNEEVLYNKFLMVKHNAK